MEQAQDNYIVSRFRKIWLQAFARETVKKVHQGLLTDCDAFVLIVQRASLQVTNAKVPSFCMIDDLHRVLIGDGMSANERNTGRFALEFGAFGDTGFKREFRDGGHNQVQHAAAGLVIGYSGDWLLDRFVYWQEDTRADELLYDVTIPLGRNLTRQNYMSLDLRLQYALHE